MTKNIISLVLLIVSVALSFKHGWDTFNYKTKPESIKLMNDLGIDESVVPFIGTLTMAIGILIVFPRTFFVGNLLNAMSIVFIMAMALRAGNYKMAILEIPFLALPLIMILLKYPFKN